MISIIPKKLSDLNLLGPGDASDIFSSASASGQISSRYYFPYLLFYARSSQEYVLWERIGHSICMYILRQQDGGEWNLRILLPPFPQSDAAMAHAVDRVRRFTGRQRVRMSWADENQRPWVESYGFDTRSASLSPEYIYENAKIQSATGKDFERLRRMINRAKRIPGLEIRPFQENDSEDCENFLQKWRNWNKERGVPYGGVTHARKCIKHYSAFGDILRGEVMTMDGKVCGVVFGGPITHTVGCLFVTVADKDVPGLAYLQRYNFMSNSPSLKSFSDTTSAGREGLAHMKMAFRPHLHVLHRARLA